jgi:hypothetical protein
LHDLQGEDRILQPLNEPEQASAPNGSGSAERLANQRAFGDFKTRMFILTAAHARQNGSSFPSVAMPRLTLTRGRQVQLTAVSMRGKQSLGESA